MSDLNNSIKIAMLEEELSKLKNYVDDLKQQVEFWKTKYETFNSVVITQTISSIEELNSLKQSFEVLKSSIIEIESEKIYWKKLAEEYQFKYEDISNDYPEIKTRYYN